MGDGLGFEMVGLGAGVSEGGEKRRERRKKKIWVVGEKKRQSENLPFSIAREFLLVLLHLRKHSSLTKSPF